MQLPSILFSKQKLKQMRGIQLIYISYFIFNIVKKKTKQKIKGVLTIRRDRWIDR